MWRGYRTSVQLEFKPQDLWVGAYWKSKEDELHMWLCVLPMLPIHIVWRAKPVKAVLFCPNCGCKHIDRGYWAKRVHHMHWCEFCHHLFEERPYAVGVPTVIEREESGDHG